MEAPGSGERRIKLDRYPYHHAIPFRSSRCLTQTHGALGVCEGRLLARTSNAGRAASVIRNEPDAVVGHVEVQIARFYAIEIVVDQQLHQTKIPDAVWIGGADFDRCLTSHSRFRPDLRNSGRRGRPAPPPSIPAGWRARSAWRPPTRAARHAVNVEDVAVSRAKDS